jgi:hypothetical protein
MAFINGDFIMDNHVKLDITNQCVYDISGKCIIYKYRFDVKIDNYYSLDTRFNIVLNNIIKCHDDELMQLIRGNTQACTIVYDKSFIEFVVHCDFQFIKVCDNVLYTTMSIK